MKGFRGLGIFNPAIVFHICVSTQPITTHHMKKRILHDDSNSGNYPRNPIKSVNPRFEISLNPQIRVYICDLLFLINHPRNPVKSVNPRLNSRL